MNLSSFLPLVYIKTCGLTEIPIFLLAVERKLVYVCTGTSLDWMVLGENAQKGSLVLGAIFKMIAIKIRICVL